MTKSSRILAALARWEAKEIGKDSDPAAPVPHGFTEPATFWRIDSGLSCAVPIDVAARWHAEDRPYRLFLGDYAGAVRAGKGIRT